MQFEIYNHHIKQEIKAARKIIRQANKGLPSKPVFNSDFKLLKGNGQNWLTLQIIYLDGNGKMELYNIAL